MASSLPVITVEDFTTIVEMQVNEGNKRPILGLGKGGIGKTESIEKLAKEKLKIGYIDVRLLLYAETDLKGIPYPNSDHTQAIWLQNNILPRVERDGEIGLLVLDEITSVAKSVRTAAYQLLNERRLGEYELPDGWFIVALGNGIDDGGDYGGIEPNFANRCSIFNVVTNLEAWKKWALSKSINPLVVGYISWRPEHLHTFNPDKDDDFVFASPRSWKAVSDILNKTEYDAKNKILNCRLSSNIGTFVGNQFSSFCKYKESAIEPSDILSGKALGKYSDNTEVLLITMQSLVKLMGECISNDIVNNNNCLESATVQKCANGVKWLLALRKMEYKVMGIKDFISVNKAIVTRLLINKDFKSICPELVEFTKENSEVFKL